MKALRIFLFILILIGIALLSTQKYWVPKLVNQILLYEASHPAKTSKQIIPKQTGSTASSISITTQKIKEDNFSGTVSKISGKSTLALKMQEYINTTVAEFRKQANTDVPDMRDKFGADNPTANYEIDINSKYIESAKAESIVTDVYSYTGGAHGSTVYKVLTANRASGKILSISQIVKKEDQTAFTVFVKKALNDWRPEGSAASPVFPDEVKALTFNSFTNWSMDDENLTIYFDQYAIGPGVLGATAFPLPLQQIKNFLQL